MQRLDVLKTYKLLIGGAYERSESGRYLPLRDKKGGLVANIAWASRKDLRNAVVAARGAQSGWAGRSAYNRGQILYRIAEMMEGRKTQFVAERMREGATAKAAEADVAAAIDLWVHYAGWCDKYQQVFSAVNPVSSAHFNFSVPEPTGVVGVLADAAAPLQALAASLAPVIASGNTVVWVGPAAIGASALTFGEVLGTSDLPAGVVNLLVSERAELRPHLAGHMDVNAVVAVGADDAERKQLQLDAVRNLKRLTFWEGPAADPYRILALTETKTTWHPVGF